MNESDYIDKLSNELLDKEKVTLIENLAPKINSNDSEAKSTLVSVLGKIPKRPLFYIAHHITCLPEHGARDVMRYCGDYIDQIVRFTLEDKRFLAKWLRSPLGPNVRKLKKYIDLELYDQLVIFNIVYTQAKHDFNHHQDVSLFDVNDVVRFIYITKHLAIKLLPLSTKAQDYNNQGETAYKYNPIE